MDQDFQEKQQYLEDAYKKVRKDKQMAASTTDKQFLLFAGENALKCEMRGEDLYKKAKDFLLGAIYSEASLSKQKKRALFPYIEAMASATRAIVDSRQVRGRSIEDDAFRNEFLQEISALVSECTSFIRSAIMATASNTSLLEMALDYNSLIEDYFSLIKDLQACEPTTSTPGESPSSGSTWTDGLSAIR